MNKLILSILLISFSVGYCLAGGERGIYDVYPSAANAKEVLSRPLIIEKKEVDPKLKEKLEKKDPEELQIEETITQLFNENIINVFKDNYKGSSDISLKTTEEISKEGNGNFTLIKHSSYKNCYMGPDSRRHCETTYTFFVTLGNSEQQQARISFLDDVLTEDDFLFLCQQINNLMADAIAGKPNPSQNTFFEQMKETAKGKTLVISPRELSSKLGEAEIRKLYTKGALEFVDTTKTLQDYILEKKAGKMYIATGYNGPLYGVSFYLVDAESGRIISAMASGGVRVSIASGPKKEHLKAMGFSGSEIKRKQREWSIILYSFKPKHNLTKAHYKYWDKYL